MNLTNSFNLKLKNRIENIYTALFQCTTKDLSSLGLAIEYRTPITYDQNYHRLAIPSKTLLRFFHHQRSHCPNFKFDFCLTGPDCYFKKPDDLHNLANEMNDSENATYTWDSTSLTPDCFPYARAIGSYKFKLTISFIKRNSTNTLSITFSCTVSIQDGNTASPYKKDEVVEAKYIDLPSRPDDETLPPIEYFPLNLFDFGISRIFSLYNLDFYTRFTDIPPKSLQKYIKLLCCSIPNKPDKSLSLTALREKDNISYTSSDTIDQLYLHYQGEKIFGFDSAKTIFYLEQKLSDLHIVLNDEELHSLCQLGSSRNIFSRSFFLEFAVLPLILRQSLSGSALLPERMPDSPVLFNSKNQQTFQRDLWHSYLKRFTALWSNLIMPACEWFFILSLFHSYGINFHAPGEESLSSHKEKMGKIYQDLCDYISKYSRVIEKPLTDSIIPNVPENNAFTEIPYSEEYIMNNIAKNNRIHILNLSDNKDKPVYLHSLALFSKDTILRKQNENQRISNANRIQQAYKELWL